MIWCPFGDVPSARAVIAQLLDEKLVACGNILPGLTSLFVWNGESGEERECGVLLKTTAALLDPAMQRLEDLHPYDQPAIGGWTVRTSQSTSAWLEAETGGEAGGS